MYWFFMGQIMTDLGEELSPEEVQIGQHIAELVPDGATLHPGFLSMGG